MLRLGYWFCLVLLLINCKSLSGKEERRKLDKINQLELQEDIQRIYTQFTTSITDVFYQNQDFVKMHGMDLLRQYLLYDSEALKIATSPFPVLNFLDMLVFIKINKIVIKDYWIPKVYGRPGEKLFAAFEETETNMENLALKLIRFEDLARIDNVVHRWRKENPHQIKVEKIRLSDFSQFANVKEKVNKSSSFSSLLVDTESAVKAVDQMVLVANRALFLAQHIPFVIRLQMRLGVQEVIEDTVTHLQSSSEVLHELQATRPIIGDLTELAQESHNLTTELRSLVKILPNKAPKGLNVSKNLDQLNDVLNSTKVIISEIKSSSDINRAKSLVRLKQGTYHFVWFLALILTLVGTSVSLVWWGGYYWCRKQLLKKEKSAI